jgi:membrane associated rhomboid family serine protease
MAYSTRSYARSYSDSGGLTPAVKWLLIANIGIFLLQFFGGMTSSGRYFFDYFMLRPVDVVSHFFVWQPVTYMFLHGSVFHVAFNMFALWVFGMPLERAFGTRPFLNFYFLCGVGAGICAVLCSYLFGNPGVATLGSSGAIYGILMACAVMFPDQIVLMFFLFQIKMRYYVMVVGAIAFLGTFTPSSGVSDVAHLSGLGFGYIYIKMRRVRGLRFDPVGMARDRYKAWKLARAKRRFQVYLRKQGPRGPVN